MSTSAGGSSPLVSRAWRCGIGGEMLCLLTTLSRYLQASKESSIVLHNHSQMLVQSSGLGCCRKVVVWSSHQASGEKVSLPTDT